MLFNSIEFIFVFLPIVFFTYFLLNKNNYFLVSKLFLTASSLFFYAWWDIIYLPILLSSIAINYLIGRKLSSLSAQNNGNKTLLITGILLNIFLLGYFKYFDFFIQNINFFTEEKIEPLNLTLPLAISFFTFQQIAFIVDSYKDKAKERDFLNYILFVSFFPQLIAGPIVHHNKMMPQFRDKENKFINYNNIAMGLFIFSIGLFKKVVLADTFSIWALEGSQSATLSFFDAWVTSLSFTLRLYFDFSGYTDMAVGLALIFNIRLPINFNSPYQATSLISFWSSWHITLSQFVNSYVFNPIIKSFKNYTFPKGMLAVFLSMFIIGMWHGASWLFVTFSLMHGVGIVINHIWKKKVKIRINKLIGWLITFNYINVSIVFFSVKDWNEAIKILNGMFSFSDILVSRNFTTVYNIILKKLSFFMPDITTEKTSLLVFSFEVYFWITLGFVIIFNKSNSLKRMNQLIKDNTIKWQSVVLMILLLAVSLNYLLVSTGQEFLYFNF